MRDAQDNKLPLGPGSRVPGTLGHVSDTGTHLLSEEQAYKVHSSIALILHEKTEWYRCWVSCPRRRIGKSGANVAFSVCKELQGQRRDATTGCEVEAEQASLRGRNKGSKEDRGRQERKKQNISNYTPAENKGINKMSNTGREKAVTGTSSPGNGQSTSQSERKVSRGRGWGWKCGQGQYHFLKLNFELNLKFKFCP